MLVQNFSIEKKMKKKKKTSHHQYLMKFFHFFIINFATCTYECIDSFSNFGITVDSEVSGTNKSLVSVDVE